MTAVRLAIWVIITRAFEDDRDGRAARSKRSLVDGTNFRSSASIYRTEHDQWCGKLLQQGQQIGMISNCGSAEAVLAEAIRRNITPASIELMGE